MTTMINGVDRDALTQTVDAVRADPTLAAFEFRLANRWIDGGENRSVVDGFHGTNMEHRHARAFELVNDEPPVLLSGDRGPNPVEHVLHALAGCLTTSLVYHAAARGLKVDAVRTRFEGDLDLRGFLGIAPEVRNGYKEIRVVFEIEGDFSEAQKAELVRMAEARSPVFDIVRNGVPVRCALVEAMQPAAA
jgi:uncharacterized OsmC-like protein